MATLQEFQQRYLRPCGKATDCIPLAILLSVLLLILSELLYAIVGLFVVMLGGVDLESSTVPAYLQCAKNYLPFIIWFVLCPVCAMGANRPMFEQLLLRRSGGNTLKHTLLGLLAGAGLNATAAIISILRGDLTISFVCFEPLPLLFLLFVVFIQSGAEELTDRLYLFQKLRRRYRSPWVAFIFSAGTFAALHLGNTGITVVAVMQIFAVGILASLLVYYFDALGAAMALHTGWNYTQNVILGLPNSGLPAAYSIFKVDSAANGPFYDTTFGIEGSVGAVFLLTLAIVAILYYVKKNEVQPVDIWAEAEAEALKEQAAATE